MKKYLFVSGVLLLLLACGSSGSDEIRNFIPGTYVRFSDHEMRKEYDTIKIHVISSTGKNYKLIRSSCFQRKLERKDVPWEYTKEEWTAVYDENKRVKIFHSYKISHQAFGLSFPSNSSGLSLPVSEADLIAC